MSAEPIASGANGPAPWPMIVHPMVRTRKKVPMNSAKYFFMTYLLLLSIATSSADSVSVASARDPVAQDESPKNSRLDIFMALFLRVLPDVSFTKSVLLYSNG